jgi:hypothetical protein
MSNDGKVNIIIILKGTGCGRKNSPIWEANKNKTEQDNFLKKIFNSIHNAVLKFKNYRVLQKELLDLGN